MIKGSTALVVFGATGDLFSKKVVPSLLRLQREGRLPKRTTIIGFGRREMDTVGFRVYVASILAQRGEKETKEIKKFLEQFIYLRGEFDSPHSFVELKTLLVGSTTKLFYLAIPPELFAGVLKNVAQKTLGRTAPPTRASVRLMVEKPFGRDGKSSAALDRLLHKYFLEKEIYRIDHYLAKRVLSELPFLKKKDSVLTRVLQHPQSITVRLLESVGVEHRGAFYDSVGALRDVGQNHLLIKIALALMSVPKEFSATSLRSAREKVLTYFPRMTAKEIRENTIRAQYDGYRDITGVTPQSNVETYFRVKSQFKQGPFTGVPFILEAGKRVGEALKEIMIQVAPRGSVHIQLEPELKVVYENEGKRTVVAKYKMERGSTQYTEEYSELISDAIRGDLTRFLSSKEVALLWGFIDPISTEWKKADFPLHTYKKDARYTEVNE